jgi:hypothetical protein
MNPDGSGAHQVSNSPNANNPSWSPDGTKLVATGPTGLFTIGIDGSNLTSLTTGNDADPAWSPDGTRIAFDSSRGGGCNGGGNRVIWVMNADGTGQTQITPCAPCCYDYSPNWSPDGTKLVASLGGVVTIMNPDGTGATPVTQGTYPAWSPDGTKIVFFRSYPPNPESDLLFTINPDGTGETQVTGGGYPDWQPLPLYPHPRSAPSIQVSLVPAFTPCDASETTGSHAAPFAVGSCAPNPTSTQAVLGPSGTAAETIQAQAGPADMALAVAASDIRTPAGADYDPNGTAGNDLRAVFRVRFTDNSNCAGNPCFAPYNKSATAAELDFPQVYIDCVPNGDPTPPGSDCNVSTTANTLLPGSIVGGKQMVLQVFRVRVDDAGNALFLQQGVFAP